MEKGAIAPIPATTTVVLEALVAVAALGMMLCPAVAVATLVAVADITPEEGAVVPSTVAQINPVLWVIWGTRVLVKWLFL